VHNAIQKTADKIRDEFGESRSELELEPERWSVSRRTGGRLPVEIRSMDGRLTVRAAREGRDLDTYAPSLEGGCGSSNATLPQPFRST
jgi:hypothetical protein